MALVWNYEFRKHLCQFREEDGPGSSARFYILFLLTLHADEQGRCWPKVRTLADEAGYELEATTAALEWLREHEAFCHVPYKYRLPSEMKLPPRKHIFQLTGFVRLDGERVYYLYCNPDTLAHMEDNFKAYTANDSVSETLENRIIRNAKHSEGETEVFPALEVVPEEEVSPTTEPLRAGEAGAATASPPKAFSFDRNADAPVAPPDTGSPGRREEELPDQRTDLEKVLCGIFGRKTISGQAVEILNTNSSAKGGQAEAHLPSPNQAYADDPLYFRWVNESRVPFFVRERAKAPKEWTSVHIARYLRATYGVYQEWAEKQGAAAEPPAPVTPAAPSRIGKKEWFNWEADGEGDETE